MSKPNVNVKTVPNKPVNAKPLTITSTPIVVPNKTAVINSPALKELTTRREKLLADAEMLQKAIDFLQQQ